MGNPYAAKNKRNLEVQEKVVTPVEEPSDTQDLKLGVADLSVKHVLAMVGDDVELAEAALAEERDGKNRTTLVSELEDIVNG